MSAEADPMEDPTETIPASADEDSWYGVDILFGHAETSADYEFDSTGIWR